MARQGVLDKNLGFITAEMTLATVAPHLARFRAFAETSFAAAEVEVIAKATNCLVARWVGTSPSQSDVFHKFQDDAGVERAHLGVRRVDLAGVAHVDGVIT